MLELEPFLRGGAAAKKVVVQAATGGVATATTVTTSPSLPIILSSLRSPFAAFATTSIKPIATWVAEGLSNAELAANIYARPVVSTMDAWFSPTSSSSFSSSSTFSSTTSATSTATSKSVDAQQLAGTTFTFNAHYNEHYHNHQQQQHPSQYPPLYNQHRLLLQASDVFTPLVQLILICVCSGIVFCLLAYYLYFKVYLKSRIIGPDSKVTPIRYLEPPPPPIIYPPPENPPRKANKFEVRHKRFLKDMEEIQRRALERQNIPKKKRLVSVSANIYNICCPCWYPKPPDYEEDYWGIEEEVYDSDRLDVHAMGGNRSPEEGDDEHVWIKKSKRPVPVVQSSLFTETKDDEVYPDLERPSSLSLGASIFDIDHLKKPAYIVNERLKARKQLYIDMEARGEFNAVAENCGPSRSLRSNRTLPPGYEVDPIARISQDILKLRIMYKFDDPDENKVGWYFGRIMSNSYRKGFNFNLKFEKFETGTAYIDGIQNVNLELSGENAYGRKWVILRKIDGSEVEADELIHFSKFQPSDYSQKELELAKQVKAKAKKIKKDTGGGDDDDVDEKSKEEDEKKKQKEKEKQDRMKKMAERLNKEGTGVAAASIGASGSGNDNVSNQDKPPSIEDIKVNPDSIPV